MRELPARLVICSHCILTICNLNYFPFWFKGLDLGSNCFSIWSLHTFTLRCNLILQDGL